MSKAKAPAKRKLFLVVRQALGVRTHFGLEFSSLHGFHDDLPREVPVRAFTKKAEAEAFAGEQDDEVRAAFPMPVLMETVGEFTRLAEWLPPFLAAHGLPPIIFPKERYPSGKVFREWWAAHAADLTAEQKAALWEPFAGMTFHRVRQIELEG